MMHVGVLGGGQLAQMLAQAGIPIGVKVTCLDTSADSCAALVTQVTQGDPHDRATVERWVRDLDIDVLTYESEFIDAAVVRDLPKCAVHPSPLALSVSQERVREKTTFRQLGIPVPDFRGATDVGELREALDAIGLPAVVKLTRGGYDGKGQAVVRSPGDFAAASELLSRGAVIVEALVDFRRELSLIAVRDQRGSVHEYSVTANEHRSGILHRSIAPAPELPPEIQRQVVQYAHALLENVDYVGVMGFEFFDLGDRVLANEFAPRPHNSGHWTIEGAVTSQFENHLRAIVGLPVGSTKPSGFSTMMNLIGRAPDTATLLRLDESHLHLYGKDPRRGRKLGHVTVVSDTESSRVAVVPALSELVAPASWL
jgi:5-(carboxyamino)imidazole ribonucleotide synthase